MEPEPRPAPRKALNFDHGSEEQLQNSTPSIHISEEVLTTLETRSPSLASKLTSVRKSAPLESITEDGDLYTEETRREPARETERPRPKCLREMQTQHIVSIMENNKASKESIKRAIDPELTGELLDPSQGASSWTRFLQGVSLCCDPYPYVST